MGARRFTPYLVPKPAGWNIHICITREKRYRPNLLRVSPRILVFAITSSVSGNIAIGRLAIESIDVILFNNAAKLAYDVKAGPPPLHLEEAAIPFEEIQRAVEITPKHISTGRLNRLFGRPRRSGAPKDTLRDVIGRPERALSIGRDTHTNPIYGLEGGDAPPQMIR